jgi:hypothetical protein
MRVLVLVVAVVCSAGSAQNAQGRHAIRSGSCGMIIDPIQKQTCFNNANVSYAVESQREMVDEQNQQAAAEQERAAYDSKVRRCESVVRAMMSCEMVLPMDAASSRDYCVSTLGPAGTAHGYGQTLCYEQATTCDQMKWCLSH